MSTSCSGELTSHYSTSYQVLSQLAFWLRRYSNLIFKMAAILDSASEQFSLFLIYTLIFPIKFQVNWLLGSGVVVQNRFLRWQRWRPSWISDWNNLSNFLLTSCPDTSYQVSSHMQCFSLREFDPHLPYYYYIKVGLVYCISTCF